MHPLLISAIGETLYMVAIASVIGIFLGGIVGTVLYITGKEGICECLWMHHILSFIVNIFRSIPYIILIIFLVPVTRFFLGTTIGTLAACIPLAVAAIMLMARIFEEALRSLPIGLVQLGYALGANRLQIVMKILLPEALPQIISGCSLIIINIIGFSAMAGAVGGGGLGDLAIRYGYQRYDMQVLLQVVGVLILMVQFVQGFGIILYRKTFK